MAGFFNDAGYRTVLVHPGTTRVWPKGDAYLFRKKYYSWDFEYAGPSYAWATMPDQFVLDFVRRRELKADGTPRFIEYALVSSHAPWAEVPPIVRSWDALGNGAGFKALQGQSFPIVWPHFENAGPAYVAAIIYDFKILQEFISRYIDDGSLILILGDHQPVFEVTGGKMEWGVPIHALSRNPDLVQPFINRGYTPGIRPRLNVYPRPFETLLPSLLRDFSTAPGEQPPG
jgi:hypothetical protein